MLPPNLTARARAGWSAVTGIPGAFAAGEVRVFVADEIPIAPSGWIGIVAIGDACLVMAPDEGSAAIVMDRAKAVAPADLPLSDWPQAREVLGPAALFFGGTNADREGGTVQLTIDDPRVQDLLARVPPADAIESGLGAVSSAVFAVVIEDSVVAACGYSRWPGELAHVSVLTDPDWRRRGFARRAAGAALEAAVLEDRLPQWRARPVESQHLARSLGLAHLGTQVSLRARG